MLLPFNAEIYFYRQPISFRYQIDGLIRLVSDQLNMNPSSGQIFIFRNKGLPVGISSFVICFSSSLSKYLHNALIELP